MSYMPNDPLKDFKSSTRSNIPIQAFLKVTKQSSIADYATILENKFPYFQNLTQPHKEIFLKRVVAFIKTHKFVPSEMPEVTTEMKVMISASAIQLTFGLSDFLARHIKGFRVYPDVYFSRLMKGHLKGHYSPKGIIFLSYKHFEDGYAKSSDGVNLGLHEMAHALHFTYAKQFDYSFFFNDVVKHWFQNAKDGNHIQLPDKVEGFLRKYSATNIHEFFAVCVENFFERPQELYNKLPDVYKHMCFILNQNPLYIELIKQIPISSQESKPVFTEKVSLVSTLVIISIAAIIYSILIYNNNKFGETSFIPIIVFGPALLTKLFTMRKIMFFNDYIQINNYLFKSTFKQLSNSSILYIAHYRRKTRNSTENVLSFVHYNKGLKETYDVIEPSRKFLSHVSDYCKQRNITFVKKA